MASSKNMKKRTRLGMIIDVSPQIAIKNSLAEICTILECQRRKIYFRNTDGTMTKTANKLYEEYYFHLTNSKTKTKEEIKKDLDFLKKIKI